MQVNELPNEFKEALPVLKILEENNYEAYFVGGSVRDIVLNNKINDVDIATSAFPKEVKSIFKSTVDIGIEHGTVLVLLNDGKYEVTTFRTESDYEDFRRPDSVTFVRSLDEDLKRRDFQMNALAMNSNGKIIDLFNGIEDIKQKRICAVGKAEERFNEDALRMLRAIRFASQLDFNIEKETYNAIVENNKLLQHISIERIYQEWCKLIQGLNPSKGIDLLITTDCYLSCPGFESHKFELLDFSKRITSGITENQSWLLLAYLFNFSNKEIKKWLKSWKCSNNLINTIAPCIDYLKIRLQRQLTTIELYELGLEKIILIESVLKYLNIDYDLKKVTTDYENLTIHKLTDLKVDGKILMQELKQKPGKWLGTFFNIAKENVLNKKWPNNKEYLINQAKKYINNLEELK